MAYSRYVPELKDNQGNVYGVKDTEAREQIGNLSSSFNAYGPAITRSLSTSKNLAFISPQYLNREINGVTVTLADDGETYVVNGTATANNYIGLSLLGLNDATAWSKSFIGPKTYTFSLTGMSGFSNTSKLQVRYQYIAGTAMTTIVSQTTSNRIATITFTDVPYLAILFANGNTYTNCKFKIQIEEGETATNYVAPAGMVDYNARKIAAENQRTIQEIQSVIPHYNYADEKKSAESFDVVTERYENIEYTELLYDIASIDARNSISASYDTNVRFHNIPHSIKVVTNDTDGYSDVQPTTATPFALIGVQEIDVALYVEDVTKVSSIRFQTIESSMSKQITSAEMHNGWNYLRFATYGSGVDTAENGRTTNTVKWRVRIYTTESINVWIGSIVVVKPDRANLIIIDDAGYKSFFDIAYPAFKAINAPVTWAFDPMALPDTPSGSRPLMSPANLESMAYDGISEFSFHSFDGTDMTSATAEQALSDTVNSIRYLKKHGLEPDRIFRAAWLQNDCPNHELADLELDASASYNGATGFVMFPFPDKYNIPRYAMQGRTTELIDNWFAILKNNHNTLLIYTHGISDHEQDTSESLLAYYVQKCQAGMQEGWLNCTTYNRLMNHYKRIG